jgi:hypothetical protein
MVSKRNDQKARGTSPPSALAFKPDLSEAAQRWQAYFDGEMIDRPVVCVTAPKGDEPAAPASTYRDRVFGDMDDLIDGMIASAERTFYGGEAIPTAWLSFGPDEIACFCGAELVWSDDSGDTNWSRPSVDDWDQSLPLSVQEDNPLWKRMLAFYRRAAERLAGKMLLSSLDLHTNMDLLASLRGPEQLCIDLIDRPEAIDRAMMSARQVFPLAWKAIAEAGKMRERGFCHLAYAPEGAAILQCDFSCMISSEMFRRWILPALEEEAEIVMHAIYHWDGPGALVHTDDLVASQGLHTLSYVPGHGRGTHIDYLELYQRVQRGGKAVHFSGTPQELKEAHRVLNPNKVLYTCRTETQAEAEELLEWFTKNT